MKYVRALAVGAILVTGVAYAQDAEPTDPNAIARSELMKLVGQNTGVLGGMANGKEPFDAAKAEAAKAALIEAAGKIEATFAEQGAADPVSEAKPEIWTSWDDFAAKGAALKAAAEAMDASSLEGVKAGMGAIGGTCKDCHSTYRM